ncbi:hypothetical protein CEUSTIGMA_g5517.t1 [Chlamydomonas eustigma]|uniref:Dynein regulatory complex protein 10 n=1 Tax=Chlamydomonas eustigma TaxID=1157962 RepID=A0A250X4S4_9CHLO|nr:hypothetical protein CEUSTIGMA_g5517.t1 [Chlamydomonas eustigma]|eukprot:GAX78075.1 hypothetical protein CEUSTIGMA_g5517.t1 [Chlamydomonas eustigma]
MNSLEASRILSVLDESLEELSLLSFVTTEVLETSEQLRDVLGEDMVNNILKHRTTLQQHGKSNLGAEPVMASTWELVRLMKKSPSTQRLQRLHTDRSEGMLQVLSYMTKLRHYAQKRLTTTVEEDNSNREYYEEVKEREERAVSEKIQLEQKLKLQRVELQKQSNQVQNAEDKTRAELHELQNNTQAHQEAIERGAAGVRHEDFMTFDTELQVLQRELDSEKARLVTLREENKLAEANYRKTKKRAQQDVESVIGEYDQDLGSKESEFQEEFAEYQAVLQKLETFTAGYTEMYRERLDYEDEQKRIAEDTLQKGLHRVRTNRAARVIQAAWRAMKARRAAELKKKKKAEAAKKKKK